MSDTSQGEGWWIASDGKWYPPEQHPDYVAPIVPEPAAEPPAPVTPTAKPSFAAETVAMSAATPPQTTPPEAAPEPTPAEAAPVSFTPADASPGPTFAPAGAPATQTYTGPGISSEPSYNLPTPVESTGSKRNLILGLGAAVLIAGLGFLAFRFFTGADAAGGASSPEAAIDQLIASVNERDAVGFVDIFDPDEIEAWFGSFAPAFANFEETGDQGETTNEISEAYASIFRSFDYSITGPGGGDIAYQVEALDENGRISRVRLEGLDFELTVDESDTALIVGFGSDPTGLDVSEVDGTRAEFRDERDGLAAQIFVPGQGSESEFAPDAHIDLVTVQKNGKWYVSIGYTMLEIARNQGEFDGYPQPDFGRAFELVDSKTGGADSPEAVVQQLFSSIESLDYDTIITITDPYGTPYLHDYQPLIDSQIDQRDRQEAAREAGLRFDALELGVSEWEGRTLVTTADISARATDASFVIDTVNWCITVDDQGSRDEVCLEDGMAELLFELDSDLDPRDFIPEQTGFIVTERNGRWYLDPLGTMGFYADQVAEIGQSIADEFEGSPATEFGDLFIVEGPIARQGTPAVTQSESGSAGVAVDLSGYPVVGDDFSDFNVAVARVVTDAPGSFVSYDRLPVTGEDWIVVYDRTDSDSELPAIGVTTDGSLDVELFDVEISPLGADGYSGQLGGQGRPQIFALSDDTAGLDLTIDGAWAETVFGWESNGVILNRPGSSYLGNGAFLVVYGDPGATFSITAESFEEPEPEPEPEPEEEPEEVEPPEEIDPLGEIDDIDALLFASLVEPSGYLYSGEQPGGFFDGCGGPDDPDVSTYIFEEFDAALVLITPYPSADRAAAAFESMVDIASPCAAFSEIEVLDVVTINPTEIRIDWQFVDDPASLTFEQYRLSGDTIVAASNTSLDELEVQMELIRGW